MFGRLATYFLERRKLRTSRHALHRYPLQDTKTNAHASKNGTGNYETTSENQKTQKKRRRAGYGGTKMATVGRTRPRRNIKSHLPTHYHKSNSIHCQPLRALYGEATTRTFNGVKSRFERNLPRPRPDPTRDVRRSTSEDIISSQRCSKHSAARTEREKRP